MVAEITDWEKWCAENNEDFDYESYKLNLHLYSFDIEESEDDKNIYEWLAERGYRGGGDSWNGINFGLIILKVPDRIEDIRLDLENLSIRVTSNDLDLLTKTLDWVLESEKNEDLCLKAIEIAEEHSEMD